jgi:hypothetical protein
MEYKQVDLTRDLVKDNLWTKSSYPHNTFWKHDDHHENQIQFRSENFVPVDCSTICFVINVTARDKCHASPEFLCPIPAEK